MRDLPLPSSNPLDCHTDFTQGVCPSSIKNIRAWRCCNTGKTLKCFLGHTESKMSRSLWSYFTASGISAQVLQCTGQSARILIMRLCISRIRF